MERMETQVKRPPVQLTSPAWLLGPAIVALALLFVAPLLLLLSRSVLENSHLTFRYYAQIFTKREYAQVFGISFEIAAISTLACLLLGYPAAYVLSKTTGTMRAVLLGMILLPFWTNILVRCYAWILVLQNRGAINRALFDGLGVISEPLSLVFNFTGVIIAMVHYLLPPTILVLDSVMRTVDGRLLLAAESMGANRRQAFFRVFVPLTMPGIRAAGTLIFIMGLGFFITPALLGGRTELTAAMLINFEFTELIDWGFGSALAMVLAADLCGLVGLLFAARATKASPRGGGQPCLKPSMVPESSVRRCLSSWYCSCCFRWRWSYRSRSDNPL
jgi:putative spermidine/putrescine transport system permease protein